MAADFVAGGITIREVDSKAIVLRFAEKVFLKSEFKVLAILSDLHIMVRDSADSTCPIGTHGTLKWSKSAVWLAVMDSESNACFLSNKRNIEQRVM